MRYYSFCFLDYFEERPYFRSRIRTRCGKLMEEHKHETLQEAIDCGKKSLDYLKKNIRKKDDPIEWAICMFEGQDGDDYFDLNITEVKDIEVTEKLGEQVLWFK